MDPNLRTWFETIPLPILIISAEGRVIASNSAADQLIGLGIEGRHHVTVLRQPGMLDAVENTMADGKTRETRYRTEDQLWVATVSGLPPPEGALVTFNDVTEVEEAHEMRRDFVANVSHELRTPLTAVMGFIETMTGPAKGDEAAQTRFLEIMQNEATRMSRLVDDLLSLSRVEATARSRPRDRVELAELCRSAAKALQPIAATAQAELHLSLPDDGITIPGDGDQLHQVLGNLMTNAVKYGASRIDLHLEYKEHVPALTGAVARISVKDDGPGIEEHHIARLTERFYRVDTHRSRAAGGTGLGLAIVKHIVGRHRGRLTIESTPNVGSTFMVDLPISQGLT